MAIPLTAVKPRKVRMNWEKAVSAIDLVEEDSAQAHAYHVLRYPPRRRGIWVVPWQSFVER